MAELVSKTWSLLTSLNDCITVDDVVSGGETLISISIIALVLKLIMSTH